MRRTVIAVVVLAAALASCGGEPAASFDDAPGIVAALDDGGIGCDDPEEVAVDPESEGAVIGGLVSMINCTWPTEQRPDLPGDLPAALVFRSEADRVAGIVSVVVFGCAAVPPVEGFYGYVHGDSWAFISRFGTIDLETLEEVGEVLGGEVVATECGDVAWINRGIAARDAGDVAEMKAVLGEG